MQATAGRLLRLLALLQARPQWSGADLSDRLEVSPRTVRRDVERLRDVGYPLHATRGSAGYRLGPGAVLPPLLLDDDEAVAVAVGLRAAAGGVVGGIEESVLRALAKIEQVLPARLRYRLDTLQIVTVPVPAGAPKIDASTLTTIAAACRASERAVAFRLSRSFTEQQPPRGRAASPGVLGPALVPTGLGYRSRRLAYVSRRPHATAEFERAAVRAARSTGRRCFLAIWRGSCPQRCGLTAPR
jgi:biotin operon repressor BirA-like protein